MVFSCYFKEGRKTGIKSGNLGNLLNGFYIGDLQLKSRTPWDGVGSVKRALNLAMALALGNQASI